MQYNHLSPVIIFIMYLPYYYIIIYYISLFIINEMVQLNHKYYKDNN